MPANRHRAERRSYRQRRYIFFVKPSARRDLTMFTVSEGEPAAGGLIG